MAGGRAVTGAGVVAVSSTSLWYTTRGAGLVCLVLFTASVVLGVLNVSRWSRPGWPRFATSGLHRNVSLIGLVVLAIHIITAELDTFAPIGWVAVVVPFASSYRPFWLGLGTLASDLFVAVIVTSLLRRRLGHRVWRVVHWCVYLSWPVAVLHGLGTGTDPRLGWVQLLTALCVAAVLVAAGWRLVHSRPHLPGLRGGLAMGGVVALIAGGIWTYNGPLQPGWARKAGTPRSLLAASHPAAAAPASGSPGSSTGTPAANSGGGLPAVPFQAAISGKVTQQGPDAAGQLVVRINTTMTGGATGSFVVVIRGQAEGGGVALQASSVSFGPAASPGEYQGTVVALDGEQLVAVARATGAGSLQLTAALNIDPQSGSVAGTLGVSAYTGGGNGDSGGEDGG